MSDAPDTRRNFGVLGSGSVGRAIGSRLAELGHGVRMGSRSASNEAATEWAEGEGDRSHGDFADAAAFGEVVVNCTNGNHSLEAVGVAGAENFAGKTLIDIANPFEIDPGPPMRPVLTIAGDDSLAESLQRALPESRVVKTLNTMNNQVMVHPAAVRGEHVVFVCSDDEEAKRDATEMLVGFGWPSGRVIDLGPLIQARACEMYLPLWVATANAIGTFEFNTTLARAE